MGINLLFGIESGGFCEVALSTDLWFWGFPATSLKPD